MLPELAMRAERILISDSLGLDSVCRQLRSSSMSHPNCLGLAGLPNAAYKERVDDPPALEVGCCDCHSRSAIFVCDSAAEIQEVFQLTGSLGRFLFHVDVRIKLALEKTEVFCCLEEKVKS